MKRISTLLTSLAALFTVHTKAQFTEDFETLNEFTGSCWYFSEIWHAMYDPAYPTSDWRIEGSGSLITNPATNTSGTIEIMTPALNITSPSLRVAFKYRMNLDIFTKSSRTIEVGLLDYNGNYTYLDLVT